MTVAPDLNADATIVAGSFHAYYATLGTTLPTLAPTTPGEGLDAAFISLGYTTTDGSSFKVETQTKDLFAHQSDDPLRTLITSRKASVDLAFLEWDSDTMVAALGGGSVEAVSGGGQFRPPASGTIEEFAWVFDIVDGLTITRIVAERAIAAGSISAALRKDDWATLPVTVSILAPINEDSGWSIINPDFEPVS